jgi:hypothetical protein
MEIVPGVLPLISSSLDEVTSASAMSALVSDTRAIGCPVSSTVDRPTISVTFSPSAAWMIVVPTTAISSTRRPKNRARCFVLSARRIAIAPGARFRARACRPE